LTSLGALRVPDFTFGDALTAGQREFLDTYGFIRFKGFADRATVRALVEASAPGDASQRRVMYLPLMNGPYKPKDERSPTPFYFRLKRLAGY
jgi:hypothetical protein